MKKYLSAFCIRWKMETQYRSAAIGGILCQLFFGLILVALYRALYASKPQTLPIAAVSSYVWLQQAFFRMVTSSEGGMLDSVRTGGVAYELCRPVNLYGYYFCRDAAFKIVSCGMRAAPRAGDFCRRFPRPRSALRCLRWRLGCCAPARWIISTWASR